MASENKEHKGFDLYKACVWVCWILIVFMVIIYIIGQFVYKHDYFNIGVNKTLDIEWEYRTADGKSGICTVPCRLGTGLGVAVELESVLPDDITDGMYMIIMAGKDLDLYIDGALRFSHKGLDCEIPGKIVKSERFPIPISAADAGKSVKIVKNEDRVPNGNVYVITYGDLYAQNRDFIESNLIKFIMCTVLFMVALAICIFNVVMNRVYEVSNSSLRFLGYGMMGLSLWIILDSYMYQMVFNNAYVDGLLSFIIVPILPIPFIRYMNEIQEHRYRSTYSWLMVLLLLDAIVTTVLHLTDILSFERTMYFNNGLVCITIAVIIYFIIKDIRNGHIQSYKMIAIGIAVLIFFSFMEIAFVYMHVFSLNGVWLTVGIFSMLVISTEHGIREIVADEQDRRAAIEANLVKSTFLANMSHEIRTPINSIMGMNEMILRECDDNDIREYAEHIKRSGKLLLSIIGDVLDVTKIEAGKLNIVKNPYNTATLIRDCVELLKEHASPKGLETKLDIDEEMPAVLEGDFNHIKQILINLITNAAKYTHDGQISLKIYSGDITTADNGLSICNVIYEVSDTGIGIKKGDIDRLFESFTRVDEKKNAHVQGTGLGLTIVRSLARAMGGDVTVSSTYGIGSTFAVNIPQRIISESPIEDSWRNTAVHKTVEEGRYRVSFEAPDARLLVVDDNSSNLMIIKQLLKATKIQMDLCDNGTEAIELSDKQKYDVILLDHMMPEPNGIDVLKHIKSTAGGINCDTRVIVLTANAVGGSRQEYLDYGFDDYISKPVDGTTLEQVLMRHLPKSKLLSPDVPDDKEDKSSSDSEGVKSVTIFKDGEFKKIAKMFGDEDFALEVMNKVAEDTLKMLDKMKSDILVDRYEDYAISAHAIKGMMASIYFEPLRVRSMEHEKAAKEGRYDFIKEDYDEYSAECTKFCNKILGNEDNI